MSLEQVKIFYEVLTIDEAIYQQYLNKCCTRGFLGSLHWDKTKIVNFAAGLGYEFTSADLDQLWFEGDDSTATESVNSSEYGQLSHARYQM